MTDIKKIVVVINFVLPKVHCKSSNKTLLFCQYIMSEVFGSEYLKLMNLAMSFDIWKGNGSCPPLKNS